MRQVRQVHSPVLARYTLRMGEPIGPSTAGGGAKAPETYPWNLIRIVPA